ncbi:AMP-binding protein [Actinomyces vulturis]|uniref:AMP-binding protein n=1 Tax=Actinomyces vulturis TaxID=1857645 RepID=UPI000835E1A0|nr:AMP-binding protein [Actinomyces vulturis]
MPHHDVITCVGGLNPVAVQHLRDQIAEQLVLAKRQVAPEFPQHQSEMAVDSQRILIPVGADHDPVDHLLTVTYPETTALVVRTSGSTGQGKAVALSIDNVLTSARATHEALQGPGVWILALPAHHVAGVQVLVRSIVSETPLIVAANADEKATPNAIIAAIEQAQVVAADSGQNPLPIYMSLVPTQLHRLLDASHPDARRRVEALRGVSAILLGGAAASDGLLEQARAQGIDVVTTYGMSETSGGCVYNGVPLPGVSVFIEKGTDPAVSTVLLSEHDSQGMNRDESQQGSPLSEGSLEGRISLSGPMVALGYVSASDEEQANFSGTGAQRTIRTADMGLWDGRTLRILGRIDDVIVTGGMKVQPQHVETVLDAHPCVVASCVVGLEHSEWGQEVVALIQMAKERRSDAQADHALCASQSGGDGESTDNKHDSDANSDLTPGQASVQGGESVRCSREDSLRISLTNYCREHLPAPSRPKRLVFTDQLPTRGIGKIDRKEVLRRLRTEDH